MENRLPKRLGIALAASFLLLVLSLCLLFYFHGEGRFGGVFRYPTPRISVSLNDGDESAVAWGCDLTYDYVKINGDYRT